MISPISTKNNINVSVDHSLKQLKEIIAEEKGVLKLETEAIYFDFDRFNELKMSSILKSELQKSWINLLR